MSLSSPKINLAGATQASPTAWRSTVLGQAVGANFTMFRTDAAACPEASNDFDAALPVRDGQMHLAIPGRQVEVSAGEGFVVPASLPHAVASGRHESLVIIDR
ncbi:MAG: cupin [Hydrogenophaga sp.]|uniref:cupin n=1 Tax=Hydrogenophaga sp. TaxID=1904254 RepID=UPI0027168F8A|nr:cupin [Hydrogenophaga sp.]MDO9147053.1 cupin [Hydrogenophaga sp.]MDO9604163.1 cupin [Hydrogenophaga sp.]MDP2166597.1 cupin [Hydrogenophaga sp.]MDP3477084.1 cupin [Hydrogenophaga sp.]